MGRAPRAAQRRPGLTRKGRLRTPGFFRMPLSVCSVCFSTCSGARSILVTTKKAGTCKLRAGGRAGLRHETYRRERRWPRSKAPA